MVAFWLVTGLENTTMEWLHTHGMEVPEFLKSSLKNGKV